jgi:site-specific recombinase XerD
MQYLKPDELRKLLEVAEKRTKRDVAMIVLSYRHGLRASEVCELTLDAVDEENKRLIVTAKKTRKKKGEKFYEAFMPKDDIALADLTVIHQWLKEREGYADAKTSPALFLSRKGGPMLPRSWFKIFQSLATEAGLRPEVCHPHSLRHSLAMRSVAADVPLPMVSRMMRHRSIASLTPYVAVSQEDADKAKARAFSK